MTIARIVIFAAALLLVRAAAAAPTADEIAKAVEDLSAAEFDARQAATEVLWQAGAAAEAALEKASKSTDPEVRTRAGALLKKLRLGIRPDTPADVLALIDQFRYSQNPEQRRQALNELQAKERWQTVLALIRGEQNPQERRNLATTIAAQAGKIVGPLVAKGELGQAEEVLEFVATTESGLPQLTAFLVLTNRLDRQIATTRERASEGDSDAWTRLAYLLRAKGDLPEAIEAADKTNDLILRVNLRSEAGRWAEAGPLAEEFYRRNSSRLEGLSFATTFYRLAGNDAEHQRTLAEVLKLASVERLKQLPPADTQPDPFRPASTVAVNHFVTAAKTLLVNERIDDGLAIMRKINPPFAHTIYWHQHRHAESLEFVAVTPEKILDSAWLQQLPTPLLSVHPDYRLFMAAQVARQLRELGRKEQVEQIWKTLRELEMPQADRSRRLGLLSSYALQLGRTDESVRYGVEAIAAGQPAANILGVLAPREAPLAVIWHERLLADDSQMDRAKVLSLAVSLVTSNPRRGGPPENWRELVAKARDAVKDMHAKAKSVQLVAFGQTAKIRGDVELAKTLLAEAAVIYPASSIHLGDLAAGEGDWTTAAKHFAAALKANPTDITVSFLLGHALAQAGDVEAAKKQLLMANLALLAPETRLILARSLVHPTLKEEIVRQCELICRTALPDSQTTIEAGQLLGKIVSTEQPRRSALCWQQMLLHVLNQSANMTEAEGYPQWSQAIHKALARAALAERIAEGKAETVAAELAGCEKLMPAEINAAIALVPALDRAGMEQLASGVFERALDVHRKVIDEFPASATYLNNAAWLCARCQRGLDDALKMVQKAVELVPDEAAYQDTLAEVYFQRGDREAAVAAAKKCVELAPASKMFATRLAHFRDDELKTLDKNPE